MIKLHQRLLYIIAAVAFVFALVKYFFTAEVSGLFVILELISYIMFLVLIYLTDRNIEYNNKVTYENAIKLADIKANHQNEIKQLQDKLQVYTDRETVGTNEDVMLRNIADKINAIEGNGNSPYHQLLTLLAQVFEVGIGIYYKRQQPSDEFSVEAQYGLSEETIIVSFVSGDGFNGQAVIDKEPIVLNDIDEDYVEIESCSGSAKPRNVYLLPLVKDDVSVGLIELASFSNLRIQQYWSRINDIIVDSKFFKQ